MSLKRSKFILIALLLTSSLRADALPGFLERDSDSNGRLTVQESALPPQVFRKYDESGNGELSLGEFGEYWKNKSRSRRRRHTLKYSSESPRQELDLYLPKKSSTQGSLVLWIHGGSWRRGSKDFNPIQNLVEQGHMVASLNYRFSQEAKFPAQLDDCLKALDFLKAELPRQYGRPVKGTSAVGLSAGGQLALLLACQGRVERAISFGAPTNLAQAAAFAKYRSTLESLVGSPLEEHLRELKLASPIEQVRPDSGKFLLFHGTGDRRVPITEATRFAEAVARQHGNVEVKLVADGSHTLVGGPKAWEQILRFLKSKP